MSKRIADCSRRRRFAGYAAKLRWYAYWRSVRFARRFSGSNMVKLTAFVR